MHVHDFDDAVEQLKPFLSEYLQEHNIDITGKFTCLFPDHEDSTPSCNLVGEDSPRFFCHGCLEVHEPVWTYDGLKPIGEIKVGDKVLTHRGRYQKVLAAEHKQGPLWAIGTRAFRNRPLLLTPDHTCMVLRQEEALQKLPYLRTEKDERIKFYGRRRTAKWRTQKYKQSINIEECRADSVRVGDFCLYPVSVTRLGEQDLIDSSCISEYTKGPKTARIDRLPATAPLAYLYGLYLAEGSTGPRHVTWSFHIDEDDLALIVSNTLQSCLGLSSNISRRPDKSLCEVVCSKTDLAKQLEYWFGKGASNKRIPQIVIEGWSTDLKQALLQGYLDGDGTNNTNSATTVSERLAYDLFRLGVQLQIIPSLAYREAYTDKTGVYHQASWRINYLTQEGCKGFYEKIGETVYYISEIAVSKSIDNTNTPVVDLHVQYSNSFVTKLGVVHNCGRTGDIFDAVQFLEKKPKIGLEWVEGTLKYLAEKYGVEVKTQDLTEEQVYELDTYRAYRSAAALIQAVEIDKKNKLFHKEVKKRGWHLDGLAEQNVGTVTSYDDFHSTLLQQGFSRTFLKEIDLNRKDIFNPDNLVFTWRDEKGRPIGFTARNLKYETEKAAAEAKGQKYKGKKYNNQRTTGLKCNIFQKGKRFYGIDTAIEKAPPLYIFEGQADVTTARAHGLPNCVAIAGSSLHEDHIHLLKRLGIYDIILCLDGDETGQKKLVEALESKFAGNRDMRVRVVIMPEGDDPDSYLREHDLKAFEQLGCWTAFEWRLNQYGEDEDESDICHQMIPFIVNETSPVTRDKLCKILSKRTGVAFKAIVEELNILLDERAHKRSRARQDVLEETVYKLRSDPTMAEAILQETQNRLMDLTKTHDSDKLSSEDFVRSLDEQKLSEEQAGLGDVGFKLGKDLIELEEVFRGDWSEGTFICIGGKPNVGKTAFLAKLGYSIASNNDDVIVIYHTIDDTAEQLVPRFVAIAEGSRKLSINMVRQPNYWHQTVGLADILERREDGYQQIRHLAHQGRLVVKDLNHGGTLPFIENLICYFQDKYPDRKIIYILDNFHKLRDFEGKDERVRFKALSEAMKGMAIRRRCCIISTVEYTKLAPGIKPTNHNIGETGQIEYDASAIIHLYSDVTDNPESFSVCHEAVDWQGQNHYLPRVEFIVGKNKITEDKHSFFLDFWPASSDYRSVNQKVVLKESKEMKEMKKNGEFAKLDNAIDDEMKGLF